MDAADFSFAMANAHPDIVAAARYRAPSNLDHGVIRMPEPRGACSSRQAAPIPSLGYHVRACAILAVIPRESDRRGVYSETIRHDPCSPRSHRAAPKEFHS